MVDISSLSTLAFTEESAATRALLERMGVFETLEKNIMVHASNWIETIRKQGAGHGIEAFLGTYGIATDEGTALMCLAESLLRIPDTATADAMIQGTFEGRHWEHYLGGRDWLLGISGWGLLLAGRMADFGSDAESGARHALKRLVSRMGEPVLREALRAAMRLIGGQFVLGESIEDALQKSAPFEKQGFRFSYDILGEGARSDAVAQHYVESYRDGIARIGKSVAASTPLFEAPGISVKLSALHPRYQLAQKERVMRELLPRLKEILALAKENNIAVSIDAEESSRLDMSLLVLETLLHDPQFDGWNGIGFVVQAYQKRSLHVVEFLSALARKHKRIIPLRLVKGAYWDSEIKWAQTLGLPDYPVFTRKEHTDVSYLVCAQKMLSCRDFYPQFATHNVRTAASVLALASHYGWKRGEFEFQRLHGMGEALHHLLAAHAPSRIYAPVGPHKDLLAYLIRRLLENGANSSFVHLLMDETKTTGEILADPIVVSRAYMGANTAIPLPAQLYNDRQNSCGMDFGNLAAVENLVKALPAAKTSPATIISLDDALAKAKNAFPAWASTSTEDRAEIIERAAELLEKNAPELIALCACEAGKTLADGVSEVREAADYCRYYAHEARRIMSPQTLVGPTGESNQLSLQPRGVFACISPWNFPLAIFTGQITAALATGNCVVAKPAGQTPKIALRAVELLYEAGIPREVLHCAIGSGEKTGAALVADPRIDGIVFTGGTETAKNIVKTLAAREGAIIPFIAETGGQNCMVIDSSALIEQAVDDIVLSAFGSAGQRCSSLRVLFVQEDIADELLMLLAGAMRELKLGDPLDPSTDIGPVIDAKARASLLTHIEHMKKSAELITAALLPDNAGNFVAPHAFEIKSIAELKRENFGPVLHVIRFKASEIAMLPAIINSTGYGLTFGLHSRVDEHIKFFANAVRAGNIYVNRSMIGATVGVQPFGGMGLSGTGPKAGGPHYLLRFLTEKTVSTNTAAIGGNITLYR